MLTFIFFFALAAFGQEDPKLLDEFPRIQCGDFTARMDTLLTEWQRDTSQQIFVVYYGHRFRKNIRYPKKGRPEVLILDFPHRDDGLNWAKGVPRYLLARLERIGAERAPKLIGLRDKIMLVNGGYREDIGVEIWIGSAGAMPPNPTPTLSERDIMFRTDRPLPVPDQINCYAGF